MRFKKIIVAIVFISFLLSHNTQYFIPVTLQTNLISYRLTANNAYIFIDKPIRISYHNTLKTSIGSLWKHLKEANLIASPNTSSYNEQRHDTSLNKMITNRTNLGSKQIA